MNEKLNELAEFQERIRQNQAKLDEIDAKRKAIQIKAQKRKLEEDAQREKELREKQERRKKKKLSLSPVRGEIKPDDHVISMKILQLKQLPGKSLTDFRCIKENYMVLLTGNTKGKFEAWDILNSMQQKVSVEVNSDSGIHSIVDMRVPLRLPKPAEKKEKDQGKQRPEQPPGSNDGSIFDIIVVGSGCNLYLIDIWGWKLIHCVEDAHDNEIQIITPAFDIDKTKTFFTGSLDCSIKAWNASSFTCLFTLNEHKDAVLCMAYFPATATHQAQLASGSDDCKIHVWSPHDDVVKASKLPPSTLAPFLPVLKNDIKPTKTLTQHTDFISSICAVSGWQTDESFMISSSGDFTVRVWTRAFELAHVLETDKFVLNTAQLGSFLVTAVRSGEDLDEGDIEVYNLQGPDPKEWILKDAMTRKVLMPACMAVHNMTYSDFASNSQTPKGTSPIILASAEEEAYISVLFCPFKIVPPEQKQTDVVPQQPSKQLDAGTTSLVPSPSTAVSNGTYPGDALAKEFVGTVLKMGGLSPDMQRLLNVCMHLHEPPSSG